MLDSTHARPLALAFPSPPRRTSTCASVRRNPLTYQTQLYHMARRDRSHARRRTCSRPRPPERASSPAQAQLSYLTQRSSLDCSSPRPEPPVLVDGAAASHGAPAVLVEGVAGWLAYSAFSTTVDEADSSAISAASGAVARVCVRPRPPGRAPGSSREETPVEWQHTARHAGCRGSRRVPCLGEVRSFRRRERTSHDVFERRGHR